MIIRQRLKQRSVIIQSVRNYFLDQEYLEVDTPLRLPAVAPEPWIVPEISGDHFLQTSPELCMKRLLADGHERLFQFCRCFRRAERGKLHMPEFLMLEWYRTKCDYKALMDECEDMIKSVALDCGSRRLLQGIEDRVALDDQWERMTVSEAFANYASCSVDEALAQDRFEEVLVAEVEPDLGHETPCFLYDYPADLASLARLKPGDPSVAERFELYLDGVELANGFSELVDEDEQRQRFERDRQVIHQQGREPGPMPEKFLTSLCKIPEASGIALGIDRLVMLFTGAADLDDVVTFSPEELI